MFNRMVRVNLTEKILFGNSFERGEGSSANISESLVHQADSIA